MMVDDRQHREFEAELLRILEEGFPGIAVEVGYAKRWERMSVTFRWPGFADLLPEERFHRLVTEIPAATREERLRGFVWLELSPDESVEEFLKLPRSEDVADREPVVYAGLKKVRFFEELGMMMGPSPDKKCPGDFSLSAEILRRKNLTEPKIHDAKLSFIRHGAYCDCQALLTAQKVLAELHAGAA